MPAFVKTRHCVGVWAGPSAQEVSRPLPTVTTSLFDQLSPAATVRLLPAERSTMLPPKDVSAPTMPDFLRWQALSKRARQQPPGGERTVLEGSDLHRDSAMQSGG